MRIAAVRRRVGRCVASATTAKKLWGKRIATKIKPLETFYSAEEEHQDYFNKHPERAYCQIIINPKVMKLKRKFHELLHNE
ncbi:MAG: peptide-methionine (S)-S-oxide reductase [Candidatus Saccharimonadales bacterium]